MRGKSIIIFLLGFTFFLSAEKVLWGVCQKQDQAYGQEYAHIKAIRNSLTPGQTNDLERYEKFGDEIQNRWKSKDAEQYARLMLEVCGPLSSGNFEDDRRYKVARRYALAVLEKAEEIPVELELDLTGHVVTLMIGPNAARGEDWVRRRKQDVEIRLHAWQRLRDAIDPRWDPNEVLFAKVMPPLGMPPGVDPNAIDDPVLRAEYRAAIDKNRAKIERWGEQYQLRKWLRRYPPKTEKHIIRAYSKAPYNRNELEQLLDEYKLEEKTRVRIINAVKKDMENLKAFTVLSNNLLNPYRILKCLGAR